jgi:hypothetical protein
VVSCCQYKHGLQGDIQIDDSLLLCLQVHGWASIYPGSQQFDRQVGARECCVWCAAYHYTGRPHLVPCECSVCNETKYCIAVLSCKNL